MKTKNIYLHVGPGKTGTSAIQAWLQHNQDWLKKNGVMYPSHALDVNEVSSGNVLEIFDRDSRGTEHINAKKCEQLVAKFMKSDSHTLLLSSEWFYIHINTILEQAPFKDAKVIAYLRDPIELIESNYNQSVKRHGVFTPIAPLYHGFPSLGVFGNLIQDIGKDRVILKPYHKDLFHSGSIILDILTTIGLSTLPKVEEKRINSSYQLEALEFKRILNNFPIDKIQNQLDRTLQQFSDGTSDYTLLNKHFETTSRVQMHKDLSSFRDKFDLPYLDPFISKLQTVSSKSAYNQQALGFESIQKVASFVQKKEPKLYQDILGIISENTDFYIDNPSFWEWYKTLSSGVSAQQKTSRFSWVKEKIKREPQAVLLEGEQGSEALFDEKKLAWSVQNVKQRLNLPPQMRDERVLVSHALFAMEHGQLKFAEQLFLQVLSTTPKNHSALKNINSIRVKLREQQK
ncbi:hypothetical protein I7Z51_000983 [Vibrio parahaemolyticus]|uniref:hypothetical protein n=1 Tax=Vibrio parahaemolyticus TaxID=670 RepID=UPI0003FCFE24|nr:hypothetical protein [Vibrio parahaemolyticus]ALG53104.1 hypothetical protein FORC6_2778 [Vibrio parahaemolyticus]AYF16536.1 hypothetical protein FORC72_2805 [Vibrio parahaemolyticus]EGQ7685338.1 hypothetical protein [Vibrio parahaemolyticus]EGQ7972124.1 hypothetical protein [Vibrio parahaemolyticus]EGQ8184355.1 hypothetical protein [Vibrio parahaemolyticus]